MATIQSYNIPEQPITISTGALVSNTFIIADIDKAFIIAPAVSPNTVTLEFSFDNGVTWRNPLSSPLTMTAGSTLDTSRLAPCAGLFTPDIRWRLTQTVAAVANTIFILVGTK